MIFLSIYVISFILCILIGKYILKDCEDFDDASSLYTVFSILPIFNTVMLLLLSFYCLVTILNKFITT